ncbi:MAG: di-trans,poly-cis-decaprenylcistransferase [Candidatus Lokiarchaeota archaeon]|nr:di-trans,poly-cis-decaprenylcistransferase [Candidatus Lokiarchaeota archaeon]
MEELKKIPEKKLPRHVGLILDGNRRWAKRNLLSPNVGHIIGYKNLRDRLFDFFDAGIHYLSIYALSLENVRKRSNAEIEYIFGIILDAVDATVKEETVKEEKVNFNVIGRTFLLPKSVQEKIEELKEFTKEYNQNFINLCIMYDGQEEIVDAVKAIINANIQSDKINKDTIKSHLYTRNFPEVDYIIRTGMEDGARISGFLLWDASYAEFKFRTDLWPDYDKDMVIEDIQDYINRNRRKGK